MHNSECIFCSIVGGTTPCHKIWESSTHLAFLSIFPNTEGFTVVIPKKHLGSYAFAQTDADLTELILATKKVALLLDEYFDDVARCGMFFEGYGVDHLHSKLFPMHGTAGNTAWEKKESGTVNTYFEQYPGYLSSNDSIRADDTALSALAKKIQNSQ
jgi:histidine triad (HIT) family protein